MSTATPLRIIYVSQEFPPQYGGGIGTFVAALSAAMARRGHRVTVVAVHDDAPAATAESGGVEVVRLPAPVAPDGLRDPGATVHCWRLRARHVAAFLRALCARERVDVVEFADYRAEGLAFLARRDTGAGPACLVRLHTPLAVLGKYNTGQPPHAELVGMELEALRLADGVVSASGVLAREVAQAVPELPPIHLTPHVADAGFIAEGPEEGGDGGEWSGGEILYVGRLEERKGVRELIAAAPRILEACPGSTLHLVGGDTVLSAAEPSMRAYLERLIALWPAPLRSRVTLHGRLPRTQVRERYLRARICVFPSLFESGPYTCLEAMGLGRVVVGTDNSGMAEMIQDGVSGAIAPSGDAAALAERVIALYNLPEADRRAMGRAAHARVLERYHPDASAAANEAVYHRLAHADGRPRVTPNPAPSWAIPEGDEDLFLMNEVMADRDRAASRVAELQALADRLWSELQTANEDRKRLLAELRRLGVEWEKASRRIRELEQEAGRRAAASVADEAAAALRRAAPPPTTLRRLADGLLVAMGRGRREVL